MTAATKRRTGLEFNEQTHRYRLDGKSIPGVTGLISGGAPKPALVQWAANTVAALVADHPDDVAEMRTQGRDFLYHELRNAPNRVRDAAAVRGTDVHALADKLAHGREVDVPDSLVPYVTGYLAFLDDWQPWPIFTEGRLASRKHWYAGTADLGCRMAGLTWLVDLKSSRRVYGDTCMQAGAYARADFWIDQGGREAPMPAFDKIAVAHITPDGTHLYDLGSIDDAFEEFLCVANTARTADRRKRLIGKPLERIA